MACKVLLEVKAQVGKGAELLALFESILPDTRKYDGCGGVDALRGQDDPDTLVLVETWESRAHYEKYFAWRRESGTVAKIGALVAGPPNLRYFDLTGA